MSPVLVQTETRALEAQWPDFVFRSQVQFTVVLSVLWVALYNPAFWQMTVAAMWHGTARSMLFLATLALLVVVVHATLLLLVPTLRALRYVASALFIVAALGSYFCHAYGVVLNQDMMRNVFQTDPAEAGSLVTPAMFLHLFALGVVPAVMVLRVKLPETSWRSQLRQRAGFLGVAWIVALAGVFSASADYAVFLRQYKPIRYALIPASPLVNSVGLASASFLGSTDGPMIDLGGAVSRIGATSQRPRVILFVVGETARAASFQLGGYSRQTNSRLKDLEGLTYFDHAQSCGTSTAISVPCIFSPLGHPRFNANRAGRYLNLLDTLQGGGYDVQWWDNNAGCKGVCARVKSLSYGGHDDPTNCRQSYCFDAVMLEDLREALKGIQRDTVIVFHQIGSHGPAYSERYPLEFEQFKPTCRTSELSQCSAEEVRNAYDNTIAYTDYVLSRQIELLGAASDHVDTMLVYASDHGESLGEMGIYLHGMPYAFAPEEQTHVPFLIWTSTAFRARTGLDQKCLDGREHEPVSHDNLYHTIMGAAGLRNSVYDARADILAPCEA